MSQFSLRPPNADYLGFEATPEGIVTTACKAEALGLGAVFVNDHVFNGCHSLEQLLESMDCFMQEIRPLVTP